MSDRRENSVLVALKELRGIEDDRVKREQEEARARIEAERLTREATERRLREEEEARRQAEDDRLRRIEEDKVAKVREEQLRVEDADRRARVDGEMRLREEKMRLEIQSRAGKSPLKAIGAVVLVLGLVGGVVVYKIQAANKQEVAEAQRRADETERKAELDRQAAKAANAELEKRILAITKDMDERLKAAKTDAERAQIRAEASQRQNEVRQAKARSKSRAGGTGTEAPKTGARIPGKRDINDNILEGL